MSFNKCNECGAEFPGATGASDFVNHHCGSVSLSALEQELTALDTRREYLEMRKESADRGYSRRFSGLNAQTLRHKLARIQERQIELREQIARQH